MPGPEAGRRRALLGAIGATLVVAIAFAAYVALFASAEIAAHELGGLAILIGLVASLALARGYRSVDPIPTHRLALAIVALVGMGATGALLGLDGAPPSLAFLPLLWLAALLLLTGDAFRRVAVAVPLRPA